MQANCFDVRSTETEFTLHFSFFLLHNEYLNIIVVYLSPVQLHRNIFRFISSHLHRVAVSTAACLGEQRPAAV